MSKRIGFTQKIQRILRQIKGVGSKVVKRIATKTKRIIAKGKIGKWRVAKSIGIGILCALGVGIIAI